MSSFVIKGDCTICGESSILGASCYRCGRKACHRKRCIQLITEPGQCAVPIKEERGRKSYDNTGDRLTTWKWLG